MLERGDGKDNIEVMPKSTQRSFQIIVEQLFVSEYQEVGNTARLSSKGAGILTKHKTERDYG